MGESTELVTSDLSAENETFEIKIKIKIKFGKLRKRRGKGMGGWLLVIGGWLWVIGDWSPYTPPDLCGIPSGDWGLGAGAPAQW